jgi:hypothetical protein
MLLSFEGYIIIVRIEKNMYPGNQQESGENKKKALFW